MLSLLVAGCDGNVPPAEATVFHPGDRNPLVRFGRNIAAVAVCADIGRPSHPQQAADRGARVYLASMFVIPSEFEGDSAKLKGYATQHSMTVALANFGSPTGELAAAGRSSIWSETGELLTQLNANGTGIAIATETREGWACEGTHAQPASNSQSRVADVILSDPGRAGGYLGHLEFVSQYRAR